ncbi:beta-ketoacyl-ACP synthase III [Streptomyces sp. SID9727]|uniref:beta-ketoacyl-ACP synthase III n=1 Tax=Streptomyces sp. SID9727 TaxID=2706114 RepID=UPI0013C8339B|nr:beta-ketoacyl-ACP synthase III [Streptomyces sp. SID9727]NEC66328.1 ketoacyl-ACP synthase III [Streptomyces sp. SID9727]
MSATYLTTSDVPGRRAQAAAVIAGLGTCLPTTEIDNDALSRDLDTSDAWIRTRTGVEARRRVDPQTSMRDLACAAGANALRSAGVNTADGLILATSTPDRPCPAGAPEVASRIGLGQVAAFDMAAVCSGFVYAVASAAGLITSGMLDSVLVVAAETYSRIVDPADRGTAVLFGDGAGAVLLRRGTVDEQGALLAFDLGSEGADADLIHIPGVAEQPTGERWFRMSGRKVYIQAIDRLAGSALRVTKDCGWGPEDIDAFVPHQANARIIDAVGDRLGLTPGAAVSNVARLANTASASIPLALADGVRSGQLKPGARTVLTAFGGGLTWGSIALTWPATTPVGSEI